MEKTDYRLIEDFWQGHAVFKRVSYPGGGTAFWQQITKWYKYKKYALDIYNERMGAAKNEVV